MTLPSLASLDDLEVRLNQTIIDAGERAQAQALLNYASALIRAHVGNDYVDEDGNLIDPLPDGVAEVCIEVVYRAITNPTGVTQDTTGPFTVSFGSDAAQRMYLTAQDKTILGRHGRPKLWTQSTTRGPLETASVYVPPSTAGDPRP